MKKKKIINTSFILKPSSIQRFNQITPIDFQRFSNNKSTQSISNKSDFSLDICSSTTNNTELSMIIQNQNELLSEISQLK